MFLRTYDGLIAVDQVTLIETPPTETPNGTPYMVLHYRYGTEMRTTRVHPDYVRTLLFSCGDEWSDAWT